MTTPLCDTSAAFSDLETRLFSHLGQATSRRTATFIRHERASAPVGRVAVRAFLPRPPVRTIPDGGYEAVLLRAS